LATIVYLWLLLAYSSRSLDNTVPSFPVQNIRVSNENLNPQPQIAFPFAFVLYKVTALNPYPGTNNLSLTVTA